MQQEITTGLPEFTSFDSVETYTIKLAYHWGVVPSEVIVFYPLSFGPKFLNAKEFVSVRIFEQKKSLMLIDKELVKLARRNVSDIVFATAINGLMVPLEEKVPDIARVGVTYPTAYAQTIDNYIAMLNAYPMAQRYNREQPLNFKDIKAKYVEIKAGREAQLAQVTELLTAIMTTQAMYSQAMIETKLRISDLVIISEQLHFTIKEDISEQDIFPVFDKILKPTPEIRHIVCFTTKESYQKIYAPGPFEQTTERKGAMIESTAVIRANTIVFTVSASSVYRFTCYMEEGYIQGHVKQIDSQKVKELITAFFSPYNLDIKTSEYSAQVRLYPIQPKPFDICVHYLMHRTMSPVFPFYVNESTYPLADKPKPKFRFKQKWGTNLLLPGYRSSPGKKDEAIFTVTAPKLPDGNNYISVDVLKVFSLSSLYRAMTYIVPCLVLYYSTDIYQESPLAVVYNFPLPTRPALEQEHQAKGIKKVAAQLNDEWPLVFTKAYLASVSSLRNLVKTTTNILDAELWMTQIISKTDEQYRRTVKPFPADGSPVMFYYTSISADAPYVGLAPNLSEENPIYPFVPASFVSETGYRDVTGSSESEAKSLMALTKGDKEGIVSESLDIIVGEPVKRRAVPKGPGSLIDAVVIGLGRDPDEYHDSVLEELRSLPTEIYKQQFYDSDEAPAVGDNEYINPSLYVPALEYIFGIDIYVISPETRDNITVHTFDVPRHKDFYSRSGVARECLIIYNNPGKKSDKLAYKHCELLIGEENKKRIFSPETSARLLRAMQITNKFVHATYGEIRGISQCMTSRLIPALSELGAIVVSQSVDAHGKIQSVNIKIGSTSSLANTSLPNSSSLPNTSLPNSTSLPNTSLPNSSSLATLESGLVTLFCFPSAPLPIGEDKRVYPATWEWFSSMFSPIGRSDLGVWGRHEQTKEVFYARIAGEFPLSLPIIAQDPLVSGDKTLGNYIPICTAKDKLAIILRETAKWLFEVWVIETGINDANEFVNRFFGYNTGNVEVANEESYYSPNVLSVRVFPAASSFATAMSFAESNVFSARVEQPGSEDRIFVLHSRTYTESILYVLKQHSRMMVLSPASTERKYIPGMYNSLRDFTEQPNTRILAVNQTTANVSATSSVTSIVTELKVSLLGQQSPILYHDKPRNIYYIIQSTQTATMSAAYLVCSIWLEGEKNIGYSATPESSFVLPDIPMIVYAIDMGVLSPALCLIRGQPSQLPPPGKRDKFYETIIHDHKYYCLLRLR